MRPYLARLFALSYSIDPCPVLGFFSLLSSKECHIAETGATLT
jgi:hypothetical protein